jgi:hypothetical protein
MDEGHHLGRWDDFLVGRPILLEEELISPLCEMIYLETELCHLREVIC